MALPSRKAKTAPASKLRISGISAMTRPPDWSRRLFDPVLLDVLVQAAQRTEVLAIEFVVGTQLYAVGLGSSQGHLQNVVRILPPHLSMLLAILHAFQPLHTSYPHS